MTHITAEQAQALLDAITGIESDIADFDGDRRGHYSALDFAEETLKEKAFDLARALIASEARLADNLSRQPYTFIGRDGKPVLARELEDRLIASEAARKLAEERLEKAVAALKPFANCVFNDNGDVTVSYGDLPGSAFVAAHFTIKEITE